MYQIHKIHRKKLLELFPVMAKANIYKHAKEKKLTIWIHVKITVVVQEKLQQSSKEGNYAPYFFIVFPNFINVLKEISICVISFEVGASQSLPIINDVINFYFVPCVNLYWEKLLVVHLWF